MTWNFIAVYVKAINQDLVMWIFELNSVSLLTTSVKEYLYNSKYSNV
jgi:hypothetical protein